MNAEAKPPRGCQILNFRAFEKNTLRGFFDLQLPSGIILRGCTFHVKGERRWIGFPAKPVTKPDGTQSWVNIVDFVDNKTKYLLQDMALPPVLAALAAASRGEPRSPRLSPGSSVALQFFRSSHATKFLSERMRRTIPTLSAHGGGCVKNADALSADG
jgi:hypothetical protein